MKISVVTVCYNAASAIEATILSVLNQTHPDVEYIVIDGGSTDGTVDIIRKYSDRLAYWVSEPDKGIYDAMNKGIAFATGDYINFMNAGDSFVSDDAVSSVVRVAQGNNYGVIYGDAIVVDGDFRYTSKALPLTGLRHKSCICHQAAFISNVKDVLFYDTKYKIASDYDLFARYYFNCNYEFYYLNAPVCLYSAGGLSDGNILTIKEFRKISRKYCISERETVRYYFTLTSYHIKRFVKIVLGKWGVRTIRRIINR